MLWTIFLAQKHSLLPLRSSFTFYDKAEIKFSCHLLAFLLTIYCFISKNRKLLFKHTNGVFLYIRHVTTTAVPWRRIGEWRHSATVSSALDNDRLASRPRPLDYRYPLTWRLGDLQSISRCFSRRQNLCPCWLHTRISCTIVITTPTELSRPLCWVSGI